MDMVSKVVVIQCNQMTENKESREEQNLHNDASTIIIFIPEDTIIRAGGEPRVAMAVAVAVAAYNYVAFKN